MPKLRKIRNAQKFRYNINRKRLDKKIKSVGQIQNPEIRKAWNNRRTMGRNLADIGLSNDPNKTLPVPSAKQQRMEVIKLANGIADEDLVQPASTQRVRHRPKSYVLEKMEEDANALRESGFRYPKGIVNQISNMLDKHRLNYKAMARDPTNYDQETWKQFRAKVKKFMSIPDHFDKYLKSRNLDSSNLNWTEYNSDDD